MDSNNQTLENPEAQTPPEDRTHLATVAPNSLATASISLSLSTILPTHFLLPPKLSSLLSPHPNKVGIPSQIPSLSRLSLSSSSLSPPKPSFKSTTVSANPLQSPLSLKPRRPSDPSNAAGIRRASIVWFRNDLRIHDNECLNSANNESISVLPLYCFDPRDYGKSASGFDKTGPYRATFVIESVSNLRKNLQARGSDLVVRMGKPETVIAELVKEIGADAIYAHREVSHNEVKAEEKIQAAMKEEGIEVKYSWGSTLYHVDDLPFKLEEMPTNYGGFRERVQGLEIRKTMAALDQLRGLPMRGDVEAGEIPSLVDLGLNPSATMGQDGKPAANASMVGGETEALQRLTKFAAECRAQPNKGTKNAGNDSIYGANFSCKISPWLSMGCLSPRSMFEELRKSVSRTISAASNQKDGGISGPSDTGLNWLMYELLWRDFFRFITKKYSNAKQHNATPVTACTGAIA
ncbi:Blue-light photoreceptor like [Actinidia chinensis var. chinensis]|uniref:Blue-light photoreceptor like n=1 Tax=Actinidia chinensis var. chinensis TaxID=1590841 RepID=A0A2R6PNW1_ACTCC|nr:Blue-light photoreceptor like [Actinidia chinensis var. chinensis]